MQPKRHALTQLGEAGRRVFPRRDANCPVITHARGRKEDGHVAVPSWLVNLSEDGCLVTSDHFPKAVHDVYLVIPGLKSRVHGKVKGQGKYTLHVEFTTLLAADVVDRIGRIKTLAKR